jgi:hypothetical protein
LLPRCGPVAMKKGLTFWEMSPSITRHNFSDF